MPVSRSFLILAALTAMASCNKPNIDPHSIQKTTERSRQLSRLAASEAGRITDSDARITRQLNIANSVLSRFGDEDAVKVLDEARKTLHDVGPQLSGFARMSGWISVSQLSRAAHDTASAKEATVAAEKELETIESKVERCQYLMAMAEEVSQLRGNADAAALLAKGAEWISEEPDADERRRARLAFSVALFNLDSWDNGVETLRREGDPSWSSDTLLALSSIHDRARDEERGGDTDFAISRIMAPVPTSAAVLAEPLAQDAMKGEGSRANTLGIPSGYGRSLSYTSNFAGKSRSGL